jgi:hypothetical protein
VLDLASARSITEPHLGLVVGYNMQFGRFVLGVQLDGSMPAEATS